MPYKDKAQKSLKRKLRRLLNGIFCHPDNDTQVIEDIKLLEIEIERMENKLKEPIIFKSKLRLRRISNEKRRNNKH